MSGGPRYGDPFLLQVTEGTLAGVICTEDFGLYRPTEQERDLVTDIRDEVQEFGGGAQLYVCIPIGRIWTDDPGDPNDSRQAPKRVVVTEVDDQFVRMANAAAAVGATK